MTELSAIMSAPGRLVDFATVVKYDGTSMTGEDKEIAGVLNEWAKNIGKTGLDANHEIAQMVTKAITTESVNAPSVILDAMFDNFGTIGEFDDIRGEKAPKNTLIVHDAVAGGNVERSFIDHKIIAPTWRELGVETDISLADIRRGGYKSVANLLTFITEALENKKLGIILAQVDAAILAGAANYINEATTMPTAASFEALSLYLHDISDGGQPVAFGLNKYKQALAGLPTATTYLNDSQKNQYNTTGFLTQVAGVRVEGISGQKKLPDGSFLIPDHRLFGVGGKIGSMVTRGETRVLQNTDINSEKIHIKVNGFHFGTMISDITKVAKMVIA